MIILTILVSFTMINGFRCPLPEPLNPEEKEEISLLPGKKKKESRQKVSRKLRIVRK